MVQFIFLFQPAQDRNRIFDRGFTDENGLEPALQCGVFFDMLLIFIERRRADAMQFAARQSRFDEVRRVHRAFAFARADERVHFVDEQDDVTFGLLDLIQHTLQPLFKLAAIFRAGNQGAHVERQEFAAF